MLCQTLEQEQPTITEIPNQSPQPLYSKLNQIQLKQSKQTAQKLKNRSEIS